MAPVACGQYYWIFMLAPDRYKKAASFMVGWLTTLAWVATLAIEALLAAGILQDLLRLASYNYAEAQRRWHGTLIAMVIIVVNAMANLFATGAIPIFEIVFMALHIIGLITIMAILIGSKLAHQQDFASHQSVWLEGFNGGGWPVIISYCVGFMSNVATCIGADTSVHMSEEVQDAARNVPRAVVTGLCLNGFGGFIMMLTALYCFEDHWSITDSSSTFPFLDLFYKCTGSTGGAVAMGCIVLVMTWSCAMGIMATGSRLIWAFARDRGPPGSQFLSKISNRSRIPHYALIVSSCFAVLLTLLYVGSHLAFQQVIALTITGFYGSYLLPCALLLWRRVGGHIGPYTGNHNQIDHHQTVDDEKRRAHKESTKVQFESPEHDQNVQLHWGPWKLSGWVGIVNNAYACLFMVFVLFWSLWPSYYPVTGKTMNYSSAVVGGVLILSALWYLLRAQKVYHGPVLEEEAVKISSRGSTTHDV